MLSTYKLLYQMPTPIIAGGDAAIIPVELMNSSTGDTGYANALATVEVVGPTGSNPVITATDEFFASGFSLPTSYDNIINIAIEFDIAGSYTINIKLVDKNNSDALICQTSQSVIVDASQNEADARIAVETAEANRTQADVDSAKTLVNALLDGDTKTSLLARLDVVQNEINATNGLATATTAVETAEASKTQSDVDTARALVNALPSSSDKDNLTSRLDLIQNEIDAANAAAAQLLAAQNAVTLAESTKLQSDVDSAKTLVSALPSSSDKDSLTSRLSVVQSAIDAANAAYQQELATATAAVQTAETSKTQSDVDNARTLVNALPSGSDKTNLSARLDTVQADINLSSSQELADAVAAVQKAEASSDQTDVDAARALVNALPSGTDKTSLSTRLDTVQATIDADNTAAAQLTAAKNAVVLAESTQIQTAGQTNLDAAQTLVNALPSGSDKDGLITRLNIVQSFIIATTAVIKCESTQLQSDTSAAQALVDALPSSADRGALRDRINVVQQAINDALAQENAQKIAEATAAVEKAESTQLQADVDSARALVIALPDSTTQNDLMTRLDSVQNIINLGDEYAQEVAAATAAVEKAEASKLQADVEAAKPYINALPNDSNKSDLTLRLNAVQYAIDLANATTAVVTAETSKAQADVDSAKTLVNALPSGSDKTDLLSRLSAVQSAIDNAAYLAEVANATAAVVTAETSKAQADVDSAKTLVDALPSGVDKTNLSARLDVVQNEIDQAAYQAQVDAVTVFVVKAETSKLQADVDSARTEVATLPDGTDKTNLGARLDSVQNAINNAAYQAQVDAATAAVVTAETSKAQSDVDAARTLVNALPYDSNKTNLIARLDAVQNAINLASATAAVVAAEEDNVVYKVNNAQTLINALPNGSDKDNLQARLDVVKYKMDLANATMAVVTAEDSKSQSDVNYAKNLVSALPSGSDKDSLLSRLDVVQYEIDLNKATDAVHEAEVETINRQNLVNIAQALVTALPDGPAKSSLQSRLNVVQASIDEDALLAVPTIAVQTAESSKLQADVDTARALVNALPSSSGKDSLTARLDAVQYAINLAIATAAVVTCETSKAQSDIDAAQTLVNALPSGSDKDNLQFRITAVIAYNLAQQNAVAAIDAYELTMQAFSAGDISAFKAAYANLDSKRAEAFAAFSALPDGDEKSSLENRYYVAEGKQYSAYKMTLLGFAGSNELQPVKIENIGGTSPYKITFKGVLPGSATSAYMFYPTDYLATQYNNPLYPRDMPADVLSQTPAGSDSITLSNQYIKGGQFVIVYEIGGNWYKLIFVVSDAGDTITEINKQSVSGISTQGNIWTVSRQSLIDEINACNTAITAHEIGLNIGEVTQEAHDTFATAIANAVLIRDTTDLLDINEVNAAVATLDTAKLAFLATANLINRETITDSINEASALIAGTTVGDQVGQVTQDAMNLLQTEVAKAVIVRNDTTAAQSVIDAEETALIAAINNFKANIFTAANFADIKMKAYESAAQDFLAQVLAKKKI